MAVKSGADSAHHKSSRSLEARAAALKMRLDLHQGRMPSRRRRERVVPTFEAVAAEYIAAHAVHLRDRKAEATWRSSIKQHAGKLAKLPVDTIEARDVAAALKVVWHASPSTANRPPAPETILPPVFNLSYAPASSNTGRSAPGSTLELVSL